MASNKDPSSKKPNSLINAVDPKLEDLRRELERDYSQASSDLAAKRIAQSEYEQRIGSIAKRIGSQINTISNTSSMEALVTKSITSNDSFRSLAQSRKDLMNMSTSSLQEVVRKSTSLASMEAKSLASMTIQSRPNGSGGLEGTYEQKSSERRARISHYVQEAGLAKVAIRLQNRLGTSSEKEDQLYDTMSNRTSSLQERKDLQEILRSRKVGSYKEELAKLKTTQGAFETAYSNKINTQESLSIANEAKSEAEATEKTARAMYESDSSEKNKKALEEASKAVSDFAAILETASKEAESASESFKNATKELDKQQKITAVAQNRDGDDGLNKFRAITSAGEVAAQEIRYLAVGQRLRKQQVQNSIAQYNLNKYDTAFAATQGDVQSMYETISSYDNKQYSDLMYKLDMGSKVLQEGAKTAGYAAEMAGSVHQDAGKGYVAGVKVAGQAARAIGGEYEISAAETQVTAAELKRQFNRTMSAFRSKGGQRIYDQFTTSLGATVGSGDAGLEDKLTNVASLQNALTKGNLSPSELVNLSTQVNQTVRGSGNDRYDIAVRAGEMEKKGVMNAGQYIQAMGAQSAIGGTAGGLETNLRRAFAAGINDSKLMTEFVELNAGLNQGLADIGIALEANNPFANKVQELMSKGMTESLASKAAANSVANISSFLTEGGTGPEAMAQAATIRQTFKRVTGGAASDAMVAAAMNADVSKLQALFGEKSLSEGEQKGLTAGELALYKESRSLDSNQRAQLLKGFTTDVIQNKINVAGPGDTANLYTTLRGIKSGDLSLDFSKPKESTINGTSLAAQQAKNVQAAQQFKEYKEIADTMGSAAKAFDGMVTVMKGIGDNLSALEAQKQTEKQVQDMKLDAGQFPEAVKLFGTYVEQLTGKKLPDPTKEAEKKNKKQPTKPDRKVTMHGGRFVLGE